ncbi:MAG: hypothetical protein ABI534_00690 [Chloroflexota bacterium]
MMHEAVAAPEFGRTRAVGCAGVVVVMPDIPHATRITALVESILNGEVELMLGSRFLGDPPAGGMPRWMRVANRYLFHRSRLRRTQRLIPNRPA